MKLDFYNEIVSKNELESDFVAFSNDVGGEISIHLKNTDKIKELIEFIFKAAKSCVPSVDVQIKNQIIDQNSIVTITIPKGNQKPYSTKSGQYFIKSGRDKRLMSSQELLRMISVSSGKSMEELPIFDSDIESDLNKSLFYLYFEKQYGDSVVNHLEVNRINLIKLLQNLKLAQDDHLNLPGLMFFGKLPQRFKPMFMVKAVHFPGNDIAGSQYISNEDIEGTLDIQYEKSLHFVSSNLLKKQGDQGFNSQGIQEIHPDALQEAIINALVHRDYSRLSTIQILIFFDRVEIISPGTLVNHLTIENIKHSTAIARNPIILGYASKILPYKGLGSGIPRIMKLHPKTDLINDTDKQQFKVIMWR